jgi:L-lactate dehydrogenase complex protein LldG
MHELTTARAEILERIAAVGEWAVPEAERAYRVGGSLTPDERVELFCARVADYRAEVRRVGADAVAAEVLSVCAARSAGRLVVPAALRTDWLPAGIGVEAIPDAGFSARELDAFDGVLTGCTVAIATTGTIVLTAGPSASSRNAASSSSSPKRCARSRRSCATSGVRSRSSPARPRPRTSN